MPEVTYYREEYRPQFHFTAKVNWLNDPNGCVFHDGEYHLFFQHNPTSCEHGNMTWGHAVSTDLVHWRQLENALLPYDDGTIYSGAAVVDANNTSNLGAEDRPPLLAAFTHARAPFGQAMAFSNDGGLSWEYYDEGRHVVPNQGLDKGERDPKIFRHAPSGKWIMVLWVRQGQFRFFTSDDLLHWSHASDFMGEGLYECPDLIQLPLDGDQGNLKWVLYDASFNYWVGSFDGMSFVPECGPYQGELGNNFYAAQTWNGTKDRVVQVGWMRGGKYPGMPFNQQMSFPCELSLRSTPHGTRLFRMPVTEIITLRISSDPVENYTLALGETLEIGRPGNLFDVEMQLAVLPDSSFSMRLSDQIITWSEGRVECLGQKAHLPVSDGLVELRVLVDRTSIELFGNGGEVCMSSCFLPSGKSAPVTLSADKHAIHIRTMAVYGLSSAWREVSNSRELSFPRSRE